jgi:hypothetical protein
MGRLALKSGSFSSHGFGGMAGVEAGADDVGAGTAAGSDPPFFSFGARGKIHAASATSNARRTRTKVGTTDQCGFFNSSNLA